MTVCRLTEYPFRLPDERGLLVIVGPGWLTAQAYEWALRTNPLPTAIAICGLGENAAIIAHTFNNNLFPFGSEVKID
jgi:hypothetical protein